MQAPKFAKDELVEIRSWPEIEPTLDANGCLEGLPFMPEMRAFCGHTFRVRAIAYKTCLDLKDMRRLENCVFLENLRCSGAAHHNCNRGCLIFWKTHWLKRAKIALPEPTISPEIQAIQAQQSLFCQATALEGATTHLSALDNLHFLRDLKENKIPLITILTSIGLAIYNFLAFKFGKREWDAVQGIQPKIEGMVLNLKPGERVRVKSYAEIQRTLDSYGRHKGLHFTADMKRFCGKEFLVKHRVEQIILEHTSSLRKLKDTVALEGGECDGICRLACTRAALIFFREQWLERV